MVVKSFKRVRNSWTTIGTRHVDKKNPVLNHARRNTEFLLWQTEYILGHLWERFWGTKEVIRKCKSSDKQYNDQIKKGQEEIEDFQGVIRICKSKNRQHNDQKKNRQTRIYRTLHRKLNIEQHQPHFKPGWTQLLRKEIAVPSPLVASVIWLISSIGSSNHEGKRISSDVITST